MNNKFIEYIDFERVNTMLEAFNQSTGFVTAILDLDGNVLSKSGWRTICTEFHRVNPDTASNCTISDTTLANNTITGENHHYYKCLNGMVDVAVPIIIKGEHVANLFTGQFFTEPPDVEYYKAQAKLYGFDEKAYLDALSKVPIVSKEEVDHTLNLLINITGMITDLTFEKYEYKALIEAKEKSDAAFRESESRYINLFQNNFSVQLIIDSESGAIIDANAAACRFYGYSLEKFRSLKVWDINPSDPKFILGKLSESFELGTHLVYTRHIRHDGDIRDVEIFNGRAEMDGHKLVHAIVHDITERKLAEKALMESHQRMEKVIKNDVVGVMFWDTVSGTMTYANDTFLALTGYSRQEVEEHTLTWQTLTPLEYYDLSIAEMERFQITGQIGPYEKEYLCKDGSRIWLLFAGSALENNQAVEFCVDISERKRAQSEAIIQAQRTEALLRMTSNFNAELELDKVRQTICDEACETFHAKMSIYYFFDDMSRTFRLGASTGLTEGMFDSVKVIKVDTLEALFKKRGSANILSDLKEVGSSALYSAFIGAGIQNVAYSLVERDGLTLGLLFICDVHTTQQINECIALLTGLTNHAASAITNARLFKVTKERLRQLGALRKIDLAIMDSINLQLVFKVILEEVVETLNVDAVAILHMDPATDTLVYEGAIGFGQRDFLKAAVPLGIGYAGLTALKKENISVHELSSNTQTPTFINDEGFIMYHSAPLIAKGVVLGVLEVYHRNPVDLTKEWYDFFDTLAGQAAIAIDNADLFIKLQNTNTKLLEAYDATIEGWAYALDLKDGETENHSRRVTDLTLHIAKNMGVGSESLTNIKRGALLHDIGKMGIPDSILLKPGKLTDEEWQIMRMHPTYAYDMLSKIDYLNDALEIPYSHHEKWDGSGYPCGLKGNQIPLPARIFAVVDVYDALTSDRPYRSAWSSEKTLTYIREQSGKHFDPNIVEVFINVLKKA